MVRNYSNKALPPVPLFHAPVNIHYIALVYLLSCLSVEGGKGHCFYRHLELLLRVSVTHDTKQLKVSCYDYYEFQYSTTYHFQVARQDTKFTA